MESANKKRKLTEDPSQVNDVTTAIPTTAGVYELQARKTSKVFGFRRLERFLDTKFELCDDHYALYGTKNDTRSCVFEYDLKKRQFNGGIVVYKSGSEHPQIRGTMKENEWEGNVTETNEYGDIEVQASLKKGIRDGKQQDKRIKSVWKDGELVDYEDYDTNIEVMDDVDYLRKKYDVIVPVPVADPTTGKVILNYSLDINIVSTLTSFTVGDFCFKDMRQFTIEKMDKLKSIKIGYHSFTLCSFEVPYSTSKDENKRIRKELRAFKVTQCKSLERIVIGHRSFTDFVEMTLRDLGKLKEFTVKELEVGGAAGRNKKYGHFDGTFYSCRAFSLANLPSLAKICIQSSQAFHQAITLSLINLPMLTSVVLEGVNVMTQVASIELRMLERLKSIRIAGKNCLMAFNRRGPCGMFFEDVPNVKDISIEDDSSIFQHYRAIEKRPKTSKYLVETIKNFIDSHWKMSIPVVVTDKRIRTKMDDGS